VIEGRRFVIGGLNRLTTRVARALTERGAEVVVIGSLLAGSEG